MFQEFLSLAIFGSFVWFCIITGLLFIFYMISDALESGIIAVLATVAFLVINHYSGNVPIVKFLTLSNILAYLGVGFLYASLRTYFYGRELRGTDSYVDSLELKGNVIRWWMLFPFSIISWCLTDLIGEFFNRIFFLFSNFFEKIFNSGRGVSDKKPKS